MRKKGQNKRFTTKKRRSKNVKKQNGGNLLPKTVFNKIVSIGYEFETDNLIPFRYDQKDKVFYQIEPIEMYDLYVDKTVERDTNFKIITDNAETYLIKLIRSAQKSNTNYISIKNIGQNAKPLLLFGVNDKPMVGHTEIITTFYKPNINNNIIQTTLQKSIQYIDNYLSELKTTNVEISLKNVFNRPSIVLHDKEYLNFFLPVFGDKIIYPNTTILQMKSDIKFTIQMTFGSHFVNSVDVIQGLFENSRNTTIQKQCTMFKNIVNAVNDVVSKKSARNVGPEIDILDKHQYTEFISYIKTYLIIMIYKYEVYKNYLQSKLTNPTIMYKYESYIYIRHDPIQLYNLVENYLAKTFQIDVSITETIILNYYNYIKTNPKYIKYYSIELDDDIIPKGGDETNHLMDVDNVSSIFTIQDGDIILVEFRGFQDELEELIKTYATHDQLHGIDRDLNECNKSPVGCYSLKTLNQFSVLNLPEIQPPMQEQHRQRRTKKAPNYLDDYNIN